MIIALGFGGYFSLGQGAAFGLGCYVVAILTARTGWDLAALLPLCAVVGAAASGLIALTCLRTSNLYLSMVTLAFGFVLGDVALNWQDVTKGGQGISGVAPTLLGAPATGLPIYLTAVCLVVLLALTLSFVRRGRVGRAMALIRESEIAAQSFGINTRLAMVLNFAVSGAVAALAGGLYVSFMTLADPTMFDFERTVTTLTFVVMAGVRSTGGVIVVTPALLYLQQVGSSASWGNWLPFLYSVLVIVVLMVAPGGTSGLLKSLVDRIPLFKGAVRGTAATPREGAARGR
jgi:branched-chain amino acid transport system ATP-binding protein/branched-chain amino acid transport system permease protein